MEFELKGLKFDKGLLQKISLDDLKKNTFSYEHIFFVSAATSKPILIKKAGEFLDEVFFKRYKDKGDFFYALKLVDENNVYEIQNILDLYSKTTFLNEKKTLRQEFIKNLHENKYNQAEIQIAFQKIFNFLPEDFFINYARVSDELLVRSSITAMMCTILAFFMKYDDFFLIRDVYNICYLLDYGLVGRELSYHTFIACEKERLHPGSGKNYLEDARASKEELQNFLDHPHLSYQKAKKYKELFTYPEMIKRIEFHHERKDGTGFPKGVPYLFTSKIEQLFIAADSLVSFEKELLSFEPFDLYAHLRPLFEEREELLSIEKVIGAIKKEWGNAS